MRTNILTACSLLIVPLASSCVRARAATTMTENSPARAVVGVAGGCPSDAGPMQAAAKGTSVDRNGDGYVCEKRVGSMAGETLRLYVDNDAAGSPVVMALYSGM